MCERLLDSKICSVAVHSAYIVGPWAPLLWLMGMLDPSPPPPPPKGFTIQIIGPKDSANSYHAAAAAAPPDSQLLRGAGCWLR